MFTDLHHIWILPIGLFCFTGCIQTLYISDKTWGLRSIAEGSPYNFWCPIFPEEAPKFPKNFPSLSIPRKLLRFFITSNPPIVSVVSDLVSPFMFSSDIVWQVSLGSCSSQKVPCFLGVTEFLEGLLRACEQFPGKSSPCLPVLSFSDEEGLLGSIHFSLTVLPWYIYFLFIM